MSVEVVEERLRTLLPGIYRDRTEEVRPASMGSAPLTFDGEGQVAWDRMWGSFCDLAMAGGPPHKGRLLEPGTPELIAAEPTRYAGVCAEIVRGIGLAARLRAERDAAPGWVRVRCSSDTMAEWLLRAITIENVAVRQEGDTILLPAGPGFRVEKEIKNVITVAAKTTHYWSEHLTHAQKKAIVRLLGELDEESPLLQPAWRSQADDPEARRRVEGALREATGLSLTVHGYRHWIGLAFGGVRPAIMTMRRMVASNVLCRREEHAMFVPFNPGADPNGERLARTVAELLVREA